MELCCEPKSCLVLALRTRFGLVVVVEYSFMCGAGTPTDMPVVPLLDKAVPGTDVYAAARDPPPSG